MLLSLQACHGSSERVGGSALGSAALAAEPAAASAALGACITSPPLLYHCQVRCFVLPWCGFFPLQSRVDSFHSAAKCRRFCFALEWILSAQVSFRSSVMVCRYKWSHSSATSAQALAPAVDGPRDGRRHFVLLHTSCRGFRCCLLYTSDAADE